MAEPSVRLTKVSKRLGLKTVLHDIDLEIPDGLALAIVGHNASGKTTLLNLISTLWSIDRGEGSVLGHDLRKRKDRIRRLVGYASHESQLYADLSVRENLSFFGRLHGVREVSKRMEELIGWFGVGGFAESPVRALSAGMRKRISIMKALLPQPALLLLDEPFANLDPAGKAVVEDAIRAFTSVGTVIFTAHSLDGIPLYVREKVFLQKGRVLRQGEEAILTAI